MSALITLFCIIRFRQFQNFNTAGWVKERITAIPSFAYAGLWGTRLRLDNSRKKTGKKNKSQSFNGIYIKCLWTFFSTISTIIICKDSAGLDICYRWSTSVFLRSIILSVEPLGTDGENFICHMSFLPSTNNVKALKE